LVEKIIIKNEVYQKLLDLLEKHNPNIVCGFLVGERDFQPVFSDFRRVADEIHKENQ